MKAGKNTPQSVLLYIDAVWAQNAPPDPWEIAMELGYNAKRFRVLKEKHGSRLLIHLRREARLRAEIPRFMAKQNGLLHPPQYVSSVEGAIDEAESVPVEYDNEFSMKAREKRAEQRKQDRDEAEAASQVKQLSQQVRDVALNLARSGVDPVPFLARIQREVAAERDRLRDAA